MVGPRLVRHEVFESGTMPDQIIEKMGEYSYAKAVRKIFSLLQKPDVREVHLAVYKDGEFLEYHLSKVFVRKGAKMKRRLRQ